jgi:DNA repair exonuclease SbcCD nuclease subunit
VTTPVRIAHISDSHLGYRALNKMEPESGRNQRTVDVERAFTRTVDDILARKPDGVVHSGDLFHHSRPTWQSLRHFIRQFRRIEQAGIPSLVIAGNHDTPRIRTGGSAYSVLELALTDVTFHAAYEAVSDLSTFGAFDIHVQAIPHGALTNPDPVLPRIVPGKRNMMVVHGTVPGILPTGLQTEPGEQELDHRLLDDQFDYIALGHVHLSQPVKPNAWYAGSDERFGWGDLTVTPGYLMVTLGEPGEVASIEHIDLPSRPMIPLRPVNAEAKSAEDIVEEILGQVRTLDEPEAMARVDIREAPRPVRRAVQSALRRESDRYVWSLDLAPEKVAFIAGVESALDDDPALDLHALFREFVDLRKATYPNEAFATMLLERGSQALTDAQLAESAPTPEEDSVS